MNIAKLTVGNAIFKNPNDKLVGTVMHASVFRRFGLLSTYAKDLPIVGQKTLRSNPMAGQTLKAFEKLGEALESIRDKMRR